MLKALPVLGISLLALVGCDGESDPAPDPAIVVAEAAKTTFAEPESEIEVAVASPGARVEIVGVVELATGRFRVDTQVVEGRPGGIPGGDLVIGTDGEGNETTYGVVFPTFGHRGPDRERCWYNPHRPVGPYAGTASVEESVRLVGSILESLRTEIDRAGSVGGNPEQRYEVTLKRSAERPRDDFQETDRRVWGDRYLIRELDRPLEITVSDGEISALRLTIGSYLPTLPVNERTPRRVTLEAQISANARPLRLREPSCQVLE